MMMMYYTTSVCMHSSDFRFSCVYLWATVCACVYVGLFRLEDLERVRLITGHLCLRLSVSSMFVCIFEYIQTVHLKVMKEDAIFRST